MRKWLKHTQTFIKMNICGLRFFTIYGEWGRPDMFMLKYINSKKI